VVTVPAAAGRGPARASSPRPSRIRRPIGGGKAFGIPSPDSHRVARPPRARLIWHAIQRFATVSLRFHMIAHPGRETLRTRLVAPPSGDYGGLPRRQPPRAESPGRIARCATRGQRQGATPARASGGPGLDRGGPCGPPVVRGLAGRPPAGSACADTAASRIRGAPWPAPASPQIVAGPPVPGTVATAAVRGFPGHKPGAPTPGRTARARCADPPSEDERRRMPHDAAPRFRPCLGPAIPLRRRPRRGAEHAIP